ncbi:hypothetical protein FRC10_005837, partial [Ceratobasidium sp. 414]
VPGRRYIGTVFNNQPTKPGLQYRYEGSGSIVMDVKIREYIKGGFFFAADGVAINFNKCTGPTFLTWSALAEWHVTAITTTIKDVQPAYEHFGFSIQITKRVFNTSDQVHHLVGMYGMLRHMKLAERDLVLAWHVIHPR